MKIQTVQELIEKIESTFWCMQGPPTAYFELENQRLHLTEDRHIHRYKYQTLRYGFISNNKPLAITALCEYLLKQLPETKSLGPTEYLFWRLAAKIEMTTYKHWDDIDPQTGVNLVSNVRTVHEIYTRLVIPGFNLPHISEGEQLTFIN